MKRLTALMLAAALSFSGLMGCSGNSNETSPVQTAEDTTIRLETETQPVTEIPTETETEEEETSEPETETEAQTSSYELEEGYVYSYLTGLPVLETYGLRRPIAVMFNNVQQAIPQAGIANADVIYEVPCEGGINRLMGIFQTVDGLEKIGPVRSARTYFVYYQAEWASIYVHFGQAYFAIKHLDTMFCDNLNGLENVGNVVFYRTSDRPSPHNAYTSVNGIYAGMNQMNYDMNLSYWDNSYPYSGTIHFNYEEGGTTLDDGIDAVRVIPGYPLNSPWFDYNASTGLYQRYQYGAAHVDEEGTPILVKNIVILSVPCTHYYDTAYLNFDVQAGGTGYYITNGKAVPISWAKDSEWGITHYYDASGNEIQFNPGKTFFCVVQQANAGGIQILGSAQ